MGLKQKHLDVLLQLKIHHNSHMCILSTLQNRNVSDCYRLLANNIDNYADLTATEMIMSPTFWQCRHSIVCNSTFLRPMPLTFTSGYSGSFAPLIRPGLWTFWNQIYMEHVPYSIGTFWRLIWPTRIKSLTVRDPETVSNSEALDRPAVEH